MKNRIIHLLRKSESYTKTDMVYLVGQGGWLMIGQALTAASAVLLSWFFANYINPSDYGLYKFVIAVATVAAITSLSGVAISLTRASAQNHVIKLAKIIKTQVTWGLLGALGLFLISLYYFYINNNLLGALFLASSIWTPFYEPFTNYQYFLQGKKNFQLQTKLRVSQRVLFTLLVISALLVSKDILFITSVYFASYVLTHLVFLIYTQRAYPAENDLETPYGEIIENGKKISIQNIFYVGASQLDKILLFKFLGPTQLAIYLFATAIPNELQTVLGNINSLAFPKLVDKSTTMFKRALVRKILFLIGLLSIPVFTYIALAPYIFSLLFPAYGESVFISQLYALTALFIPFNIIWLYFYAVHFERALWFGTFIVPSTFILGILIFVPIFGLFGAVLAMYIRYLIDTALGLYFFFIYEPIDSK